MSANRGNRHRWQRWATMMGRCNRYWPSYLRWRAGEPLTERERWELNRLLDASCLAMPDYRPTSEPRG